MISLYSSLRFSSIPALRWSGQRQCSRFRSKSRICVVARPIFSSLSPESAPLDYDPSRELLGIDVEPQPRNVDPSESNVRSWFGPNGQYIRELPCPSCRGRGYTPCTECDIERSRFDCSQCNGKGITSCPQCSGDCVIWEESIDEQPWEKARSSSPLKVTEDDEVDKLDIKVDTTRKSKRKYQSPSPEVNLKISRSLRSLNAKTGLFSNRMRLIHQDPILRAQRVAAIKKTKGTPEARKHASENMKVFFQNPENRLKRSMSMKGVKFHCHNCGKEGHRKHYCPILRVHSGRIQFKCRLCGEFGHNRRTCKKSKSDQEPTRSNRRRKSRCCRICGQSGHNRRTCSKLSEKSQSLIIQKSPVSTRKYLCSLCMENGHNKRRCPKKENT